VLRAAELSVSVNTVGTHIRSIYASSVPTIAPRRSDVPASCGSSQPSAVSTTFGVREGGDRRDRVGAGVVLTSVVRISVVSASLAGSQGADFVGEARVGGSAG
jgi:hypothetical protein